MNLYIDDNGNPAIPAALYALLENTVRLGLQRAGYDEDVEISLSFITAEEMRALNHQYRQQDKGTDVLSFPVPFKKTTALGDIVICTEIAEKQAFAYGHSLERELAFLTAHGLLHLLGYSHEDEENEKAMFAAQEEILALQGINRKKNAYEE